MEETPSQLIRDHLQNSGLAPAYWYVDISSRPKYDLFTVHKVETTDHFLFVDAGSEENARSIRDSICKEFGAQGGADIGDLSAIFVYCYVITDHSRQ